MIQITQVIDFIRPPLLKNNSIHVDGAATLEAAKDNSRLMIESGKIIPTLFVCMGNTTAVRIAQETFEETYQQKFVVYLCLDNQKDRTGKYVQQQVFFIRPILFKLLLNNRLFDVDSHSIGFDGDGMADMDRAVYWHAFMFSIAGRLLPEDGYQEDLTNLNEITSTYTSPDVLADEPLAIDDVKGLHDIPP